MSKAKQVIEVACRVEQWSRALVAVGILWFVCWQGLVLAGVGRRPIVIAAIYGFVFHVVFGKAYSLLPAYFERELAVRWAPALQFPLTTLGTVSLLLGAFVRGNAGFSEGGQILWAIGSGLFVSSLLLTMGTNVLGRKTGTSQAKADRRRVDRIANGFVPVVFGYLVLASIGRLRLGGVGPVIPAKGVTHLLAVGTATLLIFIVGYRLLPRFLVVHPHPVAPNIVLPAGTIGPILLAIDFRGDAGFQIGAAFVAVAIVGFAFSYLDMLHRSDRRRIGFYVIAFGVVFGMLAVGLGLYLALGGFETTLAAAHVRVATTGFLGLIIIGISYQFYPPNIGTYAGVSTRGAAIAAGLLGSGLVLEIWGYLRGSSLVLTGGRFGVFLGSLLYSYVILTLFWERR